MVSSKSPYSNFSHLELYRELHRQLQENGGSDYELLEQIALRLCRTVEFEEFDSYSRSSDFDDFVTYTLEIELEDLAYDQLFREAKEKFDDFCEEEQLEMWNNYVCDEGREDEILSMDLFNEYAGDDVLYVIKHLDCCFDPDDNYFCIINDGFYCSTNYPFEYIDTEELFHDYTFEELWDFVEG